MESEEPMDVDTSTDLDKFDELLEEGEYIESNNHITRKHLPNTLLIPENISENNSEAFAACVDIFSKEVKVKMEERAKRFGISKDKEKSNLSKIYNLYESLGISNSSENEKYYRLNVLHIRGTENMSTKDVFKYFEDYAPASLEWINDISCNVLWLDKESAARALIGLSKRIIGLKTESNKRMYSDESGNEPDDTIVNGKRHKNENVIHIKDIKGPLPPGIWRKGNNYMESRNIFLRFATRSDKKQLHAEKISKHYKKQRNSNHGELKSILTTSRKRALKQFEVPSPPIKSESHKNGIAAKNPWGSLSKNWGRTDFVEDDYLPKLPAEPVSNVKERLGLRPIEREKELPVKEDLNIIELSDESESESSSEEESWCKRSKMPRMRMHADDEEEKIQKRKGKIRDIVSRVNSKTKMKEDDLRGRLIARRRLPVAVYHEPIQVIVTNPKAIRNTFKNIIKEDEDDYVEELVEELEDEEDEEEGEIVDDSENDTKVEYVEEDEIEEEEELQSASDDDGSSTDSSISKKEVQGPRGSVIKVVQHKPKLASTVSTVWSRLNHSKINKIDKPSQTKHHSKTDLRHTLNKNDLRSRIGNHHMKGRSPLRIELRNDKYSSRQSDSE